MNFCENKIDLDKMQSFLEVLTMFKFATILVFPWFGMSCDVD